MDVFEDGALNVSDLKVVWALGELASGIGFSG